MKNTLKILGIIAILAIIGFSVVSCSSDDGNKTKFEGTWYSRDPNNPTNNWASLVFKGNTVSYKNYYNGQQAIYFEATFTFTDTTITTTHTAGPDSGSTFTDPYTLDSNGLYMPNHGGMFNKE